MTILNKTFAFATTAEGFTGYPENSDNVLSYTSGVGNPAGSLRSAITGRNKTGENYWEWTGTWEDLGVSAGSDVTQIRLNSANSICLYYNTVDICLVGPYYIYNSAGDTIIATIWNGRTPTGVEGSWVSIGNQSYQSVAAAYQASNTPIRIQFHTSFDLANNSQAGITINEDNISIDIDYQAGIDELTATGVATTPVAGTPAIGQEHDLISIGIATNTVVGIPTVAHIHDLISIGIATTPVLGVPTVAHIHDLTAVTITSNPVVGTPAIGQEHDLISIGIATNPILGTPTVTDVPLATDDLVAVGITANPVFGTPILTHIHELDAVNVVTTPILGTPTIGQTHDLTATGITSNPVLGTPTISEPVSVPVREQAKSFIFSGVDLPDTVAFDSTVKAGSLLVVVYNAWVNASSNPLVVSDNNGNTWQKAPGTEEYNGQRRAGIWYAFNVNAGSTTISINDTLDDTCYVTGVILEYSNVATSSPLDDVNDSGGTSNLWNSGDVSTTIDNSVLIGIAVQDDQAVTHTQDSPWNLIYENGTYTDMTICVGDIISESTITDAYSGGFGVSVVGHAYVAAFKGIAQPDDLVANDITANPVLGTPAIGQTHVLDAVDISTTPVLGTPTLSVPSTGGVKIAIKQFYSPTSTGTQNITTTDLGGLTPKAVLFIASNATALNTLSPDATIGFGAASSASNRWAISQASADGLSTTVTSRYGYNDSCIALDEINVGFPLYEADFTQWLTNGVQITWSTVNATPRLITAIFFAGSDLQAYVGNVTGPAASSTVDVTAPGFQPNLVLASRSGTNISENVSIWSYPEFGAAVDKVTDEHGYTLSRRPNGFGISTNARIIGDSYTGGEIAFDGPYLVTAWKIEGWDANGFSITEQIGGDSAEEIFYIALDTSDKDVTIQLVDTPTSTGNQAYSGFGFKPQAAIILQSFLIASDTADGDGPGAAEFGFGVVTSTAEYSHSNTDKENVATTVAKTKVEAEAANLCDEDGASGYAATLTSFDSDGITLNFTAVPGTAHKWLIIAFEESITTGGDDDLTATGITTTPVLDITTIGQTHVLDAVDISTTPVLDITTIGQTHVLDAVDISTTPVLGIPTVTHIHVLDASDIAVTPVLGTSVLGQTHVLDAVDISTTPVLGTPTLTHIHVLDAVDISTTPVLGTPTLGQTHVLDAVDISTTPVLVIPILGQTYVLDSTDISTTPVLDITTIGQGHSIDSVDISTTPVLGTPTIGAIGEDVLEATGISTTPVLAVSLIGQEHELVSLDLLPTVTVGTPSLTSQGEDVLEATGFIVFPVLETGSIGQIHVLDSISISTTPVLATSTIGQTHVLDSISISTTSVLGTPSMGGEHELISVDISTTPTVELSTIGQTHALDSVDISTIPIVANSTIGQTHALTAVDISTSPILGTPSMTGESTLTAVGIAVTTLLDNPIIGQTHIFSSVGIIATPELETLTIGQIHSISLNGIEILPVVGNPTLTHIHVLDATDLSTTPEVSTSTLGQIHLLDSYDITTTPLFDFSTIGQTHGLYSVEISTTPTVGSPSWELVEGVVELNFELIYLEVDFYATYLEVSLEPIYPEIEFETIDA